MKHRAWHTKFTGKFVAGFHQYNFKLQDKVYDVHSSSSSRYGGINPEAHKLSRRYDSASMRTREIGLL